MGHYLISCIIFAATKRQDITMGTFIRFQLLSGKQAQSDVRTLMHQSLKLSISNTQAHTHVPISTDMSERPKEVLKYFKFKLLIANLTVI